MTHYSVENICSQNVPMKYMLCSTMEKEIYLIVEFRHSDENFRFEIYSKQKKQGVHTSIPLTIETLSYVCNNVYGTFGNLEIRQIPDSGGNISVMDDPYNNNNNGENIVVLDCSSLKVLNDLRINILEDIELMTPYIGRQTEFNKEINGFNVIKRLFFAFIRDLHERSSHSFTDRDCAAEVLYRATPHGLRMFLLRCGLIYNGEIEMKSIIGDGYEMVSSIIKPEIMPTAQIFIHYARCEKCFDIINQRNKNRL